ncbi:MAG: hypothetical protein ACI9S8_002670 [Chlamydiales bacterium]|jgi:hypothetical protein
MNSINHRAFDRVLVIMFENQYRSYVMENPYMKKLASLGINMSNYFGVMHPSQTNYISSIAGELCNVTNDERPPPLLQRTIVDVIEEGPGDLQWKAYMDSYIKETAPWTEVLQPADAYPYVIKHNPFSSFENIIRNQSRWEKIVSESQLWQDVLNGTLPEYSWFTPNMWNDGHYLNGTHEDPLERAPALVDQLSIWLESFFGSLGFPGPNSHLPPNTLVVVTFDESDFEQAYDRGLKYTYDGPNQIYTVLLGDMIQPGTQDEGYNHYSLMRTIEKNFSLKHLGKNDQHANSFRFLWDEEFQWGDVQEINAVTSGSIALGEYQDQLLIGYKNEKGDFAYKIGDEEKLSEENSTDIQFQGGLSMASCGDHLMLSAVNKNDELIVSEYTKDSGWSTPTSLAADVVGKPAILEYGHHSFMLAWRDNTNAIQYMVYENEKWGGMLPTGQFTDGNLTLGAIGPSIFLIFKTTGQESMQVCTYNTAPYNVVKVEPSTYGGPYDDTTMGAWSPSSFPVAHFSHGANPVMPKEDEPLRVPYKAAGPLAVAELDGVMHLMHNNPTNAELMTETFSIAGVMTAKLKISYNASDQNTTSNGYGTVAEAGWSVQTPIKAISNKGDLAIARYKNSLITAFQGNDKGQICLCKGSYTLQKSEKTKASYAMS